MTSDRKFIRVDLEALSNIKTKTISPQFQEELENKILNIGMGGIFVETDSPLPTGTFFEFEFTLPASDSQVHAKGMVTWSSKRENKGMGIKFIRISTLDKKSILEYISKRLEEKGLSIGEFEVAQSNVPTEEQGFDILIVNEISKNLLKIYFREIGFDMEVSEAIGELDCEESELTKILGSFEMLGLIKIDGSKINFYYAEDQKLRSSIESWIRDNG